MSASGISVSEMNLDNSRTTFDGPPFPLRLRMVLERASSLRAAAGAEIDTIMTHHLPRADPGCECDGARARDIRIDADDMMAGIEQDLTSLDATARANNDE